MPARWLSFTSTSSDSDPRWFTPPPARTAAFSSERRPGSVLRVSSTRTRSPAASTNRWVAVATPDRWHRKLSAVRSPVSTDRNEPGDRTDLGARAREPAVVDQPVDLHGGVELGEHLGGARGACDDAFAAHDDLGDGPRVARHERGGDVAERAEILRQRAARPRRGCRRPGRRTSSSRSSPLGRQEPDEVGLGVAREHEPAEELRRRRGEVGPGVRAARLATRGRPSAPSAVLTARRFASSTSVGTIDASATAARSRLSALRTTPASRVMIRCSSSRIGAPAGESGAGTTSGRTGSEVDPAEHTGGVRRVLAPRDRLDARAPRTPGSPSSEFDARRFAPWTPVHAASPHAQRPGRVVAPSRSVQTPPHR